MPKINKKYFKCFNYLTSSKKFSDSTIRFVVYIPFLRFLVWIVLSQLLFSAVFAFGIDSVAPIQVWNNVVALFKVLIYYQFRLF